MISSINYKLAQVSVPKVNTFVCLDEHTKKLRDNDQLFFAKNIGEELLVRSYVQDVVKSDLIPLCKTPCDRNSNIKVFKGASGAGKTCILLLLAFIAKQLNMLVFYVNGRNWTAPGKSSATVILRFLDRFQDINKKIIHSASQIAHLIKDTNEKNAIPNLIKLVNLLQAQVEWPVVFLIDECNAFYEIGGPFDCFNCQKDGIQHTDPCQLGRLFKDFNNFQAENGIAYFTFSSSFNIKFDCGNINSKIDVNPMTTTEWRLLVDSAITLCKLPAFCIEFFSTAQELGQACGHLPRELRNYQEAYSILKKKYEIDTEDTDTEAAECRKRQASSLSSEVTRAKTRRGQGSSDVTKATIVPKKIADLKEIHFFYYQVARERLSQRLDRLFEKKRLDIVTNDNTLICAKLYLENAPIIRVSDDWGRSGLLVVDSAFGYRLSCPALKRVFIEKFTKVFTASAQNLVEVIMSDSTINWRAVELLFIIKMRSSIGLNITVRNCLNKATKEYDDLEILVDRIEHLVPDKKKWKFSQYTAYVCPPGQDVIDFFIYCHEKIYFIQVSKSKYSNHATKYQNLFQSNKINNKSSGASVYVDYVNALPANHPSRNKHGWRSATTQLSNHEFYLYIQLDPLNIDTTTVTGRKSLNVNEYILTPDHSALFLGASLPAVPVNAV